MQSISYESVLNVFSRNLGLRIESTDSTLEYQSIPEWDSLGHVNLMLALESEFGKPIEGDAISQLTSIDRILSFYGVTTEKNKTSLSNQTETQKIHRGLVGITFDETQISEVNSEKSELYYRGHPIQNLANSASFEEVAYLLIFGSRPKEDQLIEFKKSLSQSQTLSSQIIELMGAMKDAQPMHVLRTVVSFLCASKSGPPNLYDAIQLIGKIPFILSTFEAIRTHSPLPTPNPDHGFAEGFLFQLLGRLPSALEIDLLNQDLIVHAEHSSNASTFAARVTASTQADLGSSLCTALSAFSGPLHGGALEGVIAMLREIGEPSLVPAYVENKKREGKKILGFGHRVYKDADPRAGLLREMAKQSTLLSSDTRLFDTVEALVESMRPEVTHGLVANVDLYAGVTHQNLGIKQDLSVAVFAMARMAGWVAHIFEQTENNILIRPLLKFVDKR